MDCEPEELQFLSILGIYRESAKLIHSWRSLFARIAVSLILPLSLLFLLHIQISYYLFNSIESDDSALDRAAPDSAAEHRILQRLASDWMKLMIFKGVYLVALLVLALLSTAAAVYTVASIYSSKELSFSRVLSVVPKVWRRLMVTFVAAFVLLFGYNTLAISGLVLVLLLLDGTVVAAPVAVLFAFFYLAGLIYISIIWHLASVVSVLEDSKGFEAMRKSRLLIKGKIWTVAGIFTLLNFGFVTVEVTFRELVVKGAGMVPATRVFYGFVISVLMCAFVLFALVVQTVVYFVCKSYHHESIDKSNLSDHLEVYLGEYVPLKAKDVQLEQFHV
ncbi:polyadenylate-binding protein 1-B-binding protein [Rhynchospora pubera]|uniref:Polyadenylate-binding protein 1-B-binding protein n=1 Tax=Rhynchospora pubera TaxID=906938 RepID=A0AAV8EWL5_9POAL|nr:polyadenylate-binding protein 1-B-binding protein [Rhynchospora pubera]